MRIFTFHSCFRSFYGKCVPVIREWIENDCLPLGCSSKSCTEGIRKKIHWNIRYKMTNTLIKCAFRYIENSWSYVVCRNAPITAMSRDIVSNFRVTQKFWPTARRPKPILGIRNLRNEAKKRSCFPSQYLKNYKDCDLRSSFIGCILKCSICCV